MTEMLLDFESEIDLDPASRVVRARTAVPQVVEQVTIRSERPSAYLARQAEDWSWEDLRDYVAAQIEVRFGKFPREAMKEMGIFKSFVSRWGAARSAQIARYAFEVENGRWKGAPVRMQRFCLKSDPYFAQVIDELLTKNS